MNVTIVAKSKINGSLQAPASKSDAHRALICSAICGNGAKVSHVGNSIDVETTIEALGSLGAVFTRDGETLCYTGWDDSKTEGEVNCRESGSTLRFLLPVCSALGLTRTFTGQGRLPERPISIIIDEMKDHGVSATGDKLPLTLSGKMSAGTYTIPGNISSQFISGLLMAMASQPGASKVVIPGKLESVAYVDMTVDTLAYYGLNWQCKKSETETVYELSEDHAATKEPKEYQVEGDWSGAAFPLVAGALGGRVILNGLDPESRQGDKAVADIIAMAGAKVTYLGDRRYEVVAPETQLKPFEVDVSGIPDLFPILAVLAAGAVGTSTFHNVARLRIKESDRVETVRQLLASLGGSMVVEGDTVYVEGNGQLKGGIVDSFADHRIAMSGAVASLICQEPVTVLGAECCAKSYPDFFKDFEKIGGQVK
ncbi:MAG: 3-phosphoshikimate 1-carboxyvinyltransferase [Clostridia bacterium]|nr:3-phosphoshikimate 1-carboxyvinyltransferase [Clostridia bacterium]